MLYIVKEINVAVCRQIVTYFVFLCHKVA